MELFVITELANRGLTTAVFDPARLSASSYLELTRHAAVAEIALHPLPDLLANQRAVKDEWEIHLTRRCVTIAEQALGELMGGGAGSLF